LRPLLHGKTNDFSIVLRYPLICMETMQDILNANPGMSETYRAYGRRLVGEIRLKDLRAERDSLRIDPQANAERLKKIEADIARIERGLEELQQEIAQCLENEDRLRSQNGLPPLPESVKETGLRRPAAGTLP
jgi:hypothetical protein